MITSKNDPNNIGISDKETGAIPILEEPEFYTEDGDYSYDPNTDEGFSRYYE